MACQVNSNSWTFTGLVGAFLDLAIAYLLLCCSVLAFLTTKFLAFFGLSLPCPCNHGLFGYPYHSPCLHRLLIELPTETLSSVHFSIKTKFPFNAILTRNDHCQLNLKLVRDMKSDDELEFKGDGSYISFSDPQNSQQSLLGGSSVANIDVEGDGNSSNRHGCELRRQNRKDGIGCDKLITGPSYDQRRSDVRATHSPPRDPSKIGREFNAERLHDVQDASVVQRRKVQGFRTNDAVNDNRLSYDSATSFENFMSNVRDGHEFESKDENACGILTQELEQEHFCQAALWSELEQERLAAATAADEAMAMISRLHEEKASIEIEARQYQRILEEKSAYDAEEMNILKEIIVRREREKHFLENVVEAYRKVLKENEGFKSQIVDTLDQNEASFSYSCIDPMMLLKQLSESIDKKESDQTLDYACASVQKNASTISMGKESSILEWKNTKITKGFESSECSSMIQGHLNDDGETSQEIQKKGIMSMDEISSSQRFKSGYTNKEVPGDNPILVHKQVSHEVFCPQQLIEPGAVRTDDERDHVSEPHVHDVHIIDSEIDTCDKSTEKRIDPLLMLNNASNIAIEREQPFEDSNFQRFQNSSNTDSEVEVNIDRTSSDIVDKFSSRSVSPSRSVASELRRNSLSAIDQERLKIDSEIGWLRTRLRVVQEEKEKIKNFSERQERGITEVQLLEDIAIQLREIRNLTEPGKGLRQAPLPPRSSKGTSKKKRSQSRSVGLDQSSST